MRLDALSFTNSINLADRRMGACALASSDDFFASMAHLVEPAPAVFDPDAYGERGKLMDGWESRRKRQEGHDWCIVRLGAPGRLQVLDIDTAHFLGNHPPIASVDGILVEDDGLATEAADWQPVLGASPLRPGSNNLFALGEQRGAFSHLRLNIYPDGGVARLRVYGDVEPCWDGRELDEVAREHAAGGSDLASVLNGGFALACSDSFFGPMNNLLLPGRAENMGGGWETRRRRSPGHDWIVVRLGAAGHIRSAELDTNHFKGNFPDRASLEGANLPKGVSLLDVLQTEWQPIVTDEKLQAHHRHFFDGLSAGPFTHVRLKIFPDGGVSRLKVFGRPGEQA